MAVKIDPVNTMKEFKCHFAILDVIRFGQSIPLKGKLCVFPIKGESLAGIKDLIVQVSLRLLQEMRRSQFLFHVSRKKDKTFGNHYS